MPVEQETKTSLSIYDERDGLVPGWTEVVSHFDLKALNLNPGEIKLLKGYYRGHKRIAKGQKKRGQRILEALGKNPWFLAFEEKNGNLLTEIAKFIRNPSEQHQKQS